MGGIAIIMFYGVGLALYAAGLSPVWPWLVGACVALAWWNWRAAAVMAVAVLVSQYFKANVADGQVWVYYAASHVAFGLFAAAFLDRIAAAALVFSGGLFAASYFGVPRMVAGDLAELAFMGGLIGAWYVGPSGGIFSGLHGIAVKLAGRNRPYILDQSHLRSGGNPPLFSGDKSRMSRGVAFSGKMGG